MLCIQSIQKYNIFPSVTTILYTIEYKQILGLVVVGVFIKYKEPYSPTCQKSLWKQDSKSRR